MKNLHYIPGAYELLPICECKGNRLLKNNLLKIHFNIYCSKNKP